MVRSVSPTDLAQKAFVRGLSEDTDEETLRRTFSKFGEVVEVHIAKDRDTNAPRGFAFITFTSSTDCNKACSTMDGKEFHGRILHVELASHSTKLSGGSRGGFRGSRGRSSFRGGRGRGSPRSPPPRDASYRRGGGTARGSWRGGGGRGDFRSYGSRTSDGFYSGEERFRSSMDRDPQRDYGSRYDSEYRSARPERDYLAVRDYPSGRARDYPGGGDRDYGPPPRERDYPAYYSPPRDYPPSDRDYPPPRGRDYPPGGRDYQLARDDFDMASRRYNSRDYDYPPGNGFYDSHPPRRDYGPPSRDYGSSGRYESYESGGRAEYKSRGSFSGRGSRDMDYARSLPPRRDEDHPGGIRRPMRMSDGPPPKKMKVGEPMRRSPRGGAGRRY